VVPVAPCLYRHLVTSSFYPGYQIRRRHALAGKQQELCLGAEGGVFRVAVFTHKHAAYITIPRYPTQRHIFSIQIRQAFPPLFSPRRRKFSNKRSAVLLWSCIRVACVHARTQGGNTRQAFPALFSRFPRNLPDVTRDAMVQARLRASMPHIL
jgi:hypothetical protein